MTCLSLQELRNAAFAAGVEPEKGDGVLLPGLLRKPARAVFPIFRTSPEDVCQWFHPHALVVLDAHDARHIETRRVLPGDLGVRPETGDRVSVLDAFGLEGVPQDVMFVSALEVVERLQPFVWPLFFDGLPLDEPARRDASTFAAAWSACIWPHQRVYYETLSPEFERWLRALG